MDNFKSVFLYSLLVDENAKREKEEEGESENNVKDEQCLQAFHRG